MLKYVYSGKTTDLIPKYGYEFEKLYARNHKLYKKGIICLWVIEKMTIEIDNLKQDNHLNLIDFILENKDKPDDFWQHYVDHPIVAGYSPNFHITRKGRIFDYITLDNEYMSQYKEWRADESVPVESFDSLSGVFAIHLSLVKGVLELQDHLTKREF